MKDNEVELTPEEVASGLSDDLGEDAIIFLHGKESGPHGSKYRTLASEYSVHSPDFQGLGIWERLEKVEKITEGMTNVTLVGSSYGGLLAALLYDRHPERFRGYVLLAPAFYEAHQDALDTIEGVPENARVLHGLNDEVVPIRDARSFCEEKGLPFVEVEDGHRLKDSHPQMMELVSQVLE